MERERERKQLNSEVDPGLKKRLQKKLIDDGISYRQWLELQIRNYVSGGIDKQRRRISRRRIQE